MYAILPHWMYRQSTRNRNRAHKKGRSLNKKKRKRKHKVDKQIFYKHRIRLKVSIFN